MNEQLERIFRELMALRYMLAANALMTLVFIGTFIAYLYREENGGRFKRIANLSYQLVTTRAKSTVARLQNFAGVATVPDVDAELEVAFYKAILSDLESGIKPQDVNLTEAVWVKGRRWHSIGGTNRNQFVATLKRARENRITTRLDDHRGTWGLARPHRALVSKLRRLTAPPPQQVQNNPEMVQ